MCIHPSTRPHERARTHTKPQRRERTSFSSGGLAQCQPSNRWVFITVSCAAMPDAPNKRAHAPNSPQAKRFLMNNKRSGVMCQAVKPEFSNYYYYYLFFFTWPATPQTNMVNAFIIQANKHHIRAEQKTISTMTLVWSTCGARLCFGGSDRLLWAAQRTADKKRQEGGFKS